MNDTAAVQSTNPIDRLKKAREQLEKFRKNLEMLKVDYQNVKELFEKERDVLEYRAQKKSVEELEDEVRRLGLVAYDITRKDNPVTGVQVQHGRQLEVIDPVKLLGWVKEYLPKAVSSHVDISMVFKYAELVDEVPEGAKFVDTHKVIIRKYPEEKEEE